MRLKKVIAELERRAAAEPPAPTIDQVDQIEVARRKTIAQLQTENAAVGKRIDERSADERRLRDFVDKYQQRIEMTPTRETELTALMRDYDTLRETYRNLLVKKEDATMGAELERRRVGETLKVVEAAQVPSRPYSPA